MKMEEKKLRKGSSITIGAISFLALLLISCSKTVPAPPPKPSSWSEQLSAARDKLKDQNGDYVLYSAVVSPRREGEYVPAEPTECFVYLAFMSQKPTQTGEKGEPQYSHIGVHFDDYHLATTLRAENKVAINGSPDPGWPDAERSIQLSPQDVLKLTRAEGEGFMGAPVEKGNIRLNLLMSPQVPPELNSPAVWNITYYRRDKYLTLFIDARNGVVLKRSVEDKKVEGN